MADDTIQALLRKRLSDSSIAVKYGDAQWSWRQYLEGSTARAAALLAAAIWLSISGVLPSRAPTCTGRDGSAATCCAA